MIIPASFQAAYAAEKALIEQVQDVAGARLRALCEANRWLFAQRLKGRESTLARLQLGDIASIAEVVDIYGATVVVPTRNHLMPATDAVLDLFPGATVKDDGTQIRERSRTTTFM